MIDGGLMGGGFQLFGFISAFSQLVWLTLGVLACIWLWKQIQKP